MKLKINDNIPDVEVFQLINNEPEITKIKKIFKDKKTILLGMPGAFTSICSAKHLPGYVNNIQKFKSKGIDLIACIAVNDPFVMSAWAKHNNVHDAILMLGDPFLTFTKEVILPQGASILRTLSPSFMSTQFILMANVEIAIIA